MGKQCRPTSDSADPHQTALIRVYTACHSFCIVWTHYSMIESHSSNFRLITTNFLGVRIFRKFTVVSFMIWSFVLRQHINGAIKAICDHKTANLPLQMTLYNTIIPVLMHFCQSTSPNDTLQYNYPCFNALLPIYLSKWHFTIQLSLF